MYDELVKRLRRYHDNRKSSTIFSEAADAIDELQKQIDGWVEPERKALIKSLPRWIPATERLPGDDQRVLAYYGFDRGDGYLGMMFMQVLDYFARDPRPHFQHEGANGMKVTHWMPLPEPPEDGGQDDGI